MLPTAAVFAVPAGGPSAGIAAAYAWPSAVAEAYAVPAAGPPADAAVAYAYAWPSAAVAV